MDVLVAIQPAREKDIIPSDWTKITSTVKGHDANINKVACSVFESRGHMDSESLTVAWIEHCRDCSARQIFSSATAEAKGPFTTHTCLRTLR